MPSAFLFPSIVHLPPGYDCTIPLPSSRIGERLIEGRGHLLRATQIYCEGSLRKEFREELLFEGGRLVSPPPEPFTWRDASESWGGNSGFLELSIQSIDGSPVFAGKNVIGFYAIYTKPGKKSFLADNGYKYGSPPLISQIAMFGRYVDGYPVVRLDRDRDIGQTITLINPYKKSVVARIIAHDGRAVPKIKVPPLSVRNVPLIQMLRDEERSWVGQIQLTASNRLGTFVIMHSLRNPWVVSDHEHLDTFRSDPTHLPAFQLFRQRVGKYLDLRGWLPH